VVRLSKTEDALVSSLQQDPPVARTRGASDEYPAVGPITALTWALEMPLACAAACIAEGFPPWKSGCGTCTDGCMDECARNC
jgi:hypothetical protein